MTEDAGYHEMRETAEGAIASSLPEGEVRERHLELADRHADRAWLVRHGYAIDLVDQSGTKHASSKGTDHGVLQAIRQSRELLAQSHRILAESRSDMPG